MRASVFASRAGLEATSREDGRGGGEGLSGIESHDEFEGAGEAPATRQSSTEPSSTPSDDEIEAAATTRELTPLPPEALWVERVSSWIFNAVAIPAIVIGVILSTQFNWLGERWDALLYAGAAAVIVLLLVLAELWPRLEHPRIRWGLDEHAFEIRRGVVFHRAIHVPRSRIQHTDVTRGPLQRRKGLATLTVHTAGTHAASVAIAGLLHEDASRVRDELIADRGGEHDGV